MTDLSAPAARVVAGQWIETNAPFSGPYFNLLWLAGEIDWHKRWFRKRWRYRAKTRRAQDALSTALLMRNEDDSNIKTQDADIIYPSTYF